MQGGGGGCGHRSHSNYSDCLMVRKKKKISTNQYSSVVTVYKSEVKISSDV